jgi:hypothetical protein
MRSPLAYPLNRGADMDVGGAADLQTDVMRFMAILSLCLVAIFALVQSMPVSPPVAPAPDAKTEAVADLAPEPVPEPELEPKPETVPEPKLVETPKLVTLTRPKWVPKYEPEAVPAKPATESPVAEATTPTTPETLSSPVPAAAAQEGFTLRFESDAALTRLVAASQVGVYAIDGEHARRMTVSESRISFWDASLPNSFHEMEASTVPSPVVDALARTGVDAGNIRWGVTLPGKLKGQLDGLMQENRGGSLVIGTNGNIRLEAS